MTNPLENTVEALAKEVDLLNSQKIILLGALMSVNGWLNAPLRGAGHERYGKEDLPVLVSEAISKVQGV